MTIAEFLRKQGMQQGMQLGAQQNMAYMIKTLYQKLHSVEQVADLVNLSAEEVKKILED